MTCLTLCKTGSSSLWSWGKGKQGTSPTHSRRKKCFCQQKDRSRTEPGYLHRSSVAAGTKAAMDSYSSSSQPGLREHFMSRSVDRWAMDSYTESASSPCISSSLMWLFSMSTVSWKRGRAPEARWHSRALWAASGVRVGLWQLSKGSQESGLQLGVQVCISHQTESSLRSQAPSLCSLSFVFTSVSSSNTKEQLGTQRGHLLNVQCPKDTNLPRSHECLWCVRQGLAMRSCSVSRHPFHCCFCSLAHRWENQGSEKSSALLKDPQSWLLTFLPYLRGSSNWSKQHTKVEPLLISQKEIQMG